MELAGRSVPSGRSAERRVRVERLSVITLGELIEAVSSVARDAAEVAAVVDHLRRRSAALRDAKSWGPETARI